MFSGIWAFLGMFPGGVTRAPTDMAVGVFRRSFAVLCGVQQDVAAGTLSERDESRGEVDHQLLTEHIRGFPHDSCQLLSWVRQEDGKSAHGLGGVSECGLGPDWGFDDGAGPVLEVLA